MKKVLLMLLFIVTAIVAGALIGNAVGGIEALAWLGYSKSFSFQPGTFIDFDVFSLTFGITFRVNVAQLILMFIGIFAYIKLAPKLISK